MNLFSVFHPPWNIFSHHQRKVFRYHRVFVFAILCSLAYVLRCDVDSAADKEEYLLKSHKVIEAVPRALNRPDHDLSTTALVPNGKPTDPCSDRKSYEAILTLHRQLDDDASGDIDVSESDEFLRDELQYENGYERHREFHGDDKSISVDELWSVWKVSQVHNWTVDETVEWLLSSVELPEYEHTFRNNAVDGTCLPRMAINSNTLLSGKLGIKDSIHRQKIALKAMDVVLFGPPRHHNYLKDAILAISLVIATGGCWFAYVQHKYSQTHMIKMMHDMEMLQKAEEALSDMQQELNKAKQEQEIVNIEKLDLERRLQDEMKTSSKSHSKLYAGSEEHRLRELEEELRNAKSSLQDAEMRLGARSWVAPPTLQHWLQLTHELELRNYNKKKSVAEMQLQAAKEGCEKLRKKRSTFMGAFRIAHGGSIDDVDDRIIQAKTALSEVTSDFQERMHRWKQIEKLCGVPIIQNLGIGYLEALLKPPSMNGSAGNLHSGFKLWGAGEDLLSPTGVASIARSNSEGMLACEESPPPYAAAGISSASLFDSEVLPKQKLQQPEAGSSAVLPNIPPPPKYSKASPSYGRKVANVVSPKTLRSSNQCSASPKLSQSTDTKYGNIMEAATEDDDDQPPEAEEEFRERSTTPVSISSHSGYSDAGRPMFIMGERMIDLGIDNPIDSSLYTQKELDEQSYHSDQGSSIHSNLSISEDMTGDTLRKISTGVLEEKKKKRKTNVSSIVASLKGSFSSANFSSQEATSSESTPDLREDEKLKKDKKVFLPQLRRKKAKIL